MKENKVMLSAVSKVPPDQIFGIVDRCLSYFHSIIIFEVNTAMTKYKAEPNPDPSKIPISVIVGAYRAEDTNPWPLPTVRKV
jgi:hypothetical protein